MVNNDLLVIDKNITNKNMVVYENPPKIIFKDYLEGFFIFKG
jgi:hypothetical protein